MFQSRAVEDVAEDESGEALAVVEAFLTRHSEGVKKDEGVVVEEGGFAARREVFDARSSR